MPGGVVPLSPPPPCTDAPSVTQSHRMTPLRHCYHGAPTVGEQKMRKNKSTQNCWPSNIYARQFPEIQACYV